MKVFYFQIVSELYFMHHESQNIILNTNHIENIKYHFYNIFEKLLIMISSLY